MVSVDLDGMNVIVLKKPTTKVKHCKNRRILLKTRHDDQNNIIGTSWFENESNESMVVYIHPKDSCKFHLNADIAKTMYKYYYRGDESEPSIIHVQSVLTPKLDE